MKSTDVELDRLRSRHDVDKAATAATSAPRQGQALCLSGGGYRAAIFHLGAMLRLHELRLLGATTLFSAVSGGSIVLAWLATCYGRRTDAAQDFPAWCQTVDFRQTVVEPFRAVIGSDIRSVPVLTTLAHNWLWPTHRMRMLERRYARHFGDATLAGLPDAPAFVFCATDLTFGVNWEFGKRRVGDYLAGYLRAPEALPLARAVAASSSFPPVFGPMRLPYGPADFHRKGYAGADGDRLRARIDLTDGGVYDNLGTEPALRRYATVLVSDAGAPFAFTTHRGLRRLLRYTQVIGNQAASLRKRLYFQQQRAGAFGGAYWGLVPSRQRAPGSGYSAALVTEVLGRIRTDLDRFLAAEFEALVNHGYFSCHDALGTGTPAPAWPYPERQDEAALRRALASSHRRFLHTRWFRKA